MRGAARGGRGRSCDHPAYRSPRMTPGTSDKITFLLTDIEDSTGLVRALGDRYADVLTDSRRVLGEAVEAAGGRAVDARADEFFAVFDCPKKAVSAALAAQRALGAHAWPEGA